eukprot:5652879-Amphidinium_carterae.1
MVVNVFLTPLPQQHQTDSRHNTFGGAMCELKVPGANALPGPWRVSFTHPPQLHTQQRQYFSASRCLCQQRTAMTIWLSSVLQLAPC